MKLSIITPIYNEKKRIEAYLESLEHQTVEPEIVLVDGGSTDGTIEFIKQYKKKHKNVKLFFETGGYRSPANARNIGVKKASGDVVFVVDIDRVFEKNFIEKILKEFSENKGAKIIKFKIFDYHLVDFKSAIQESYFWRDYARGAKAGKNKMFVFKKEVYPFQDASLGYGEDKLIYKKFKKLIEKYGFVDAKRSLRIRGFGPSSLSEVWSRYKWYGRTGMLYYHKSKDKKHLAKMILAVLSLPFLPLILIPMARGLIYSLRVIREYPQGLILIPLLESVSFPAMAVGFWQYFFRKNSKKRGH